ncbi:MAG: hypothetical protein V3V05_10045 [Pontiella sp.]
MNDITEDNPIDQIMEIIIEQGFGGMDQAMNSKFSGSDVFP